MENIVFLELARRKDDNPSMDIHYWKSLDGKEVDFLVTSGKKVKSAIQVCYSFSDKRTEEREKNALLNCLQHFKLKEGLIITKDHEQIMKFKGKTIKAIPIWKWLLES